MCCQRMLEYKVRKLDALDFSAVRDQSCGRLRVLSAFHPPDNVLGEVGFGALVGPDVPSFLVFPDVERVITFNAYPLDKLVEQEIFVGRVGGRERPVVRDIEAGGLGFFDNWGRLPAEELLQEGNK